ncbi:MAG: DnaJ domain-containing protein [Cycloclasticus sp.]|nr:aconitate hydratase [Cycloclasticus sp. 46_83_sub15_T18]
MISLFILIAIVFGAFYLLRWFLNTPAETISAMLRKSLWLFLGLLLIMLAISGKLNIIFAFIGSAIPLIAKNLPTILRLLGLVKTIKSNQQGQTSKPPVNPTAMNRQQALDILNLKSQASKQDIISAHKRLMQKLHPDKGGSEHLAKQINQAKELLLKDHEH